MAKIQLDPEFSIRNKFTTFESNPSTIFWVLMQTNGHTQTYGQK